MNRTICYLRTTIQYQKTSSSRSTIHSKPHKLTRSFSQTLTSSGTHRLIKTLPYDQAKIYGVIVDVKSYPDFIPYVLSTKILGPTSHSSNHRLHPSESDQDESGRQTIANNNPTETLEELEVVTKVGYKGFETEYHSRVICKPMDRIEVIARPSSTFTNLTTTWTLSDPADSARAGSSPRTQVQLDLAFKFRNPLHEYLLTDELIWKKFSSLVTTAFENRLASLK